MLAKKMAMIVAVLTLLNATTVLGSDENLFVNGNGMVTEEGGRICEPLLPGAVGPATINLQISTMKSPQIDTSLGTLQVTHNPCGVYLDLTVDKAIADPTLTSVTFSGPRNFGLTYRAVARTTENPNIWILEYENCGIDGVTCYPTSVLRVNGNLQIHQGT